MKFAWLPMIKITLKEVFFILGISVCAIGAHQLWFSPASPEVTRLNREIAKVRGSVQALQKNQPDLNLLKKQIYEERKAARAIEDKMDTQEARILTKPELEALLKIEKFKVKVFSKAEQNLDDFKKVEYAIEFQGSYKDFLKYAASLEAGTAYVRITEFKAIKANVGLNTPLTIDLRVSAIVQNRKAFYGKREAFQIKEALFDGRDPFILVRRRAANAEKKGGLELTAVVFETKNRYAIINGMPYQEGDHVVEDVFVKDISNRQVQLVRGNQNLTLKI